MHVSERNLPFYPCLTLARDRTLQSFDAIGSTDIIEGIGYATKLSESMLLSLLKLLAHFHNIPAQSFIHKIGRSERFQE